MFLHVTTVGQPVHAIPNDLFKDSLLLDLVFKRSIEYTTSKTNHYLLK